MFIIVNKEDSVVCNFGKNFKYDEDGYLHLLDENIRFVPEITDVYEVGDLPEYFQSVKYCYSIDRGFYLNSNWEEPNQYGISNELLQQIKNDTIQEVQDELNN